MKSGIIFIIASCLINSIACQVVGYTCCGVYLMDSNNGSVVIETKRLLPPGDYLALRVRACTTDPVAVQIWRQAAPPSESSFVFRWQTVIVPTISQTNTYIQVIFSSTLTITSQDRIGLFTLSSSPQTTPPFGVDTNSNYLYYSLNKFTDFASFNSGVSITVDTLRMPRSFNQSIIFCKTMDCANVSFDVPVNNQCCPSQLGCDPTTTNVSVANQSATIQALRQQIDILTTIIQKLTEGRTPAGFCTGGFTPGNFGPGSACYWFDQDHSVALGQAALLCVDKNSTLVQINSDREESFLRDLVTGGIDRPTQGFWTGGMYSFRDQLWLWYDSYYQTQSVMRYANWFQGTTPIPTDPGGDDVCSTLVVNGRSQNGTHYLLKTMCNDPNFYICERPKSCL